MSSTQLPFTSAGQIRGALTALGWNYSPEANPVPTRAEMVGVLACVVEREVCYHVDEPDEYREMGSGFIKAALHSVTEPGLSREEHHDATIAVLCTLIGQRLMMAGRDIGTLVELKDGTDPYGAGPLATKLTQAILRLLMLTPTNNPEGPFGPQHAKELLDQCRKDLQSARQLLEDSRRKVKRGR